MQVTQSDEMEEIGNYVQEDHQAIEEFSDSSERNIPPWTKQLTLRGLVASFVIGGIYSLISMKLSLTSGLALNLNVSAGLLSFIFVRSWTKVLEKAGIVTVPFTRQENTMIQTCVVACYSIAVGGGFGSYILGLNKKTRDMTGEVGGSYKEPQLGWMTAYLFLVCFIGLFVLIPLKKILIIDYKLTFPTGVATAVLINKFHSGGEKLARIQVRVFIKYFSLSFFWGMFGWFYTGTGSCGFGQFPTFGLQAWKHSFYFDFSMTVVGTGMICPHIVNLSVLIGAVLSWGIMWPLMAHLKGDWFPSGVPESSMKSLNGYKVFLSIALMLGDGLYCILKLICLTFCNFRRLRNQRKLVDQGVVAQNNPNEDIKKDEIFIRDSIPIWVGAAGYALLSLITTVAFPLIFPSVKWYYVVFSYIFAPLLTFCNAYGAGLTDINMAFNYGKVSLFALAALAGNHDGVVAGLAGCGLIKSVMNVSCVLIQDMKTGHLTLTSPRAMFIGQVAGTLIGCIVTPLSFLLFYNAFDVGNPNGEYKAPLALVYRNIAVLGVEGFSALPKHCLQLCGGFFVFAIGINLVKDIANEKIGRWVPIPTAMAISFLIGGHFAIDLCVGSLVVILCERMNFNKAEMMVPVVASGLICGEGLWTLPAAVLSMARIKPPMCMQFSKS